jgi:hypothetical protein
MIGRRPLAELLGELADSVFGFAGGDELHVRSLSVAVPVDLRVAITDTGLELFGDVPLFLTRTAFDPDPARLDVLWHVLPVAEARQ